MLRYYGKSQNSDDMDWHNHNNYVYPAVCRSKACIRMCRHGVVHDAVPCHKSIVFNNTWHYFRKEY
ncbi:hypothetical protein [Odoribacter laneus]|uniref:hypothetical protein n=1 Tax=Odoribacter laneus TaxID=626933 RepID=UPI003AF1AFC3